MSWARQEQNLRATTVTINKKSSEVIKLTLMID